MKRAYPSQSNSTPLQPAHDLGRELGVDLWIKRDDLCPIPGGGSKVRKLTRLLRTAPSDTDALVTTGGVQSNHARTVAIAAAQHGMKCELVLHGDGQELLKPTGNLLLMLLAGAHVTIVPSDEIEDALTAVMEKLKKEGYRPLMIEGGGHSVEGALGLVDAVLELSNQQSDSEWIPDYIIHASGTGGTQAGLLAGLDLIGWPTRVIGISVARRTARGGPIVRDLYEQVRRRLQLDGEARTVEFRDEWVGEGYARALPETAAVIRKVMSLEGVPLDPTYTAKAMKGLIDLVRRGEIPRGSKVLFWHTGGLLNLMSSGLEWGFNL